MTRPEPPNGTAWFIHGFINTGLIRQDPPDGSDRRWYSVYRRVDGWHADPEPLTWAEINEPGWTPVQFLPTIWPLAEGTPEMLTAVPDRPEVPE